MSKKIIRLSSNQVLKQISNTQIANKQHTLQHHQTVEPQTLTPLNSALCGLEKPCGLFNPFQLDFEDIENNNNSINTFMSCTDDHLMMDLLNIPELDCEAPQIPVLNENIVNIDDNQVVVEQQKPNKNVSKFFKKIQEYNIPKINIPSKQIFSSFGSASSNNTADKESPLSLSNNIKKDITTDTEKMYQSFIDTQPIINFDLLDKFGSEENFEKLILGFPTPQVTKLTDVDPFLKPEELESVKFEMDHAYTANKRKISEDSMLDDSMSMDSFSSSFNSTGGGSKRQRKRGIYRAEDVTNEEERRNYLERRKKNNISSKISRANKKKAYSEIDEKCAQLESNNEEMKVKIDELENLNKVIKDMLVEKFTQCKSDQIN